MSRTAPLARNIFPLLVLALVLVPFASASDPYVIGSQNTVTADPNITRPFTTPCVVRLFQDAEFDNFNGYNFTYTPPADCPGPWAKVIFVTDVNVTAGNQFDRTANFWLGPTNIYFGTTSEPSATFGPSWHVEKDLTDYGPIFSTTQQGTADIGNLVNSTYTGIIFASAWLEFYPVAKRQTAPVTADQVLALSAGPTGGTVALSSPTDTLSGTFTFPLNVQAAYLDVYAQGQSSTEEFWYTCVPNDVAAELESCGNTPFRETEITIDGQPAGVAPIFPWIFTGGIDPFLWFPIPGVQTLNFTPYRVNLTPFAGLLSNGQPHTVALSVFNADSYFSATANLLVYTDPDANQTSGAITLNTLTAPSPVVTEDLHVKSSSIWGRVDVSSNRSFAITGYVNTSRGKVTTKVAQTENFYNYQIFDITAQEYVQDITQGTIVSASTTVSQAGAPTVIHKHDYTFPLTVNITELTLSNGNINQITTAKQTYQESTSTTQAGKVTFASSLENAGQHMDTLELDSSFNLLGNAGQSGSQQYSYVNSNGAVYNCTISAAANVLTAFGPGCEQ